MITIGALVFRKVSTVTVDIKIDDASHFRSEGGAFPVRRPTTIYR